MNYYEYSIAQLRIWRNHKFIQSLAETCTAAFFRGSGFFVTIFAERKKVNRMESNDFCDLLLMLLDDDLFWVGDSTCTDSSSRILCAPGPETAQ